MPMFDTIMGITTSPGFNRCACFPASWYNLHHQLPIKFDYRYDEYASYYDNRLKCYITHRHTNIFSRSYNALL